MSYLRRLQPHALQPFLSAVLADDGVLSKCFSAQSAASFSTGLTAADRAASSASMGTLSLTSLSPLELDNVSDS